MTEVSRNDIGGAWVERPHVTGDINPSNIDDVVGALRQRQLRAGPGGHPSANDALPKEQGQAPA